MEIFCSWCFKWVKEKGGTHYIGCAGGGPSYGSQFICKGCKEMSSGKGSSIHWCLRLASMEKQYRREY